VGFFVFNMRQSPAYIKGLFAINIAAIIFGSAALFGKLNVSPLWIVAMRGVFAAATLFLFGFIKKKIIMPGRGEVLPLTITGTVLALHWLTFFASVQLSGVAVATLTFATFPLFTLIIEALSTRSKLKAIEVLAGAMIIIAVGLLVKIDSHEQNLLLGSGSGLASALLFSVFGIMSKKLTNRLPAITVSFFQNATVAVVLAPFLIFSFPPPDEPSEWLFLSLLGVVTTALMHQLYFYALQRLTASTCSGFIALEPVYAIFFAAIFFDERVTAMVLISGFLILLASFLLLMNERTSSKVISAI
jgi:drug/metabolite transporter (DMT)-like permease